MIKTTILSLSVLITSFLLAQRFISIESNIQSEKIRALKQLRVLEYTPDKLEVLEAPVEVELKRVSKEQDSAFKAQMAEMRASVDNSEESWVE